MPIAKSKKWSVRFTEEMGATFISISGNAPANVKKAAEELCKKNVGAAVSLKIFKTQFKDVITAIEDEK